MIMLTGIKAFEARWQSLKSAHPTNASENHLLMQSMGRLVDNYASQEEIAAELPASLRGLFARLVDAYLNGHWTDDIEKPSTANLNPGLSPAMLAAKQRRQQKKMAPTASSEAATYVIRDRVSCWA
ncbi:MAG: hypothetical protein AAFP07_03135 [Cyanobacteria bacterium J06606_4]